MFRSKSSPFALTWSALCLLYAVPCAVAAQPPTPVILISIDTLRADHLSAYGYLRVRTPHIDSLAAQGTLFTEMDSQIPLTLPSHTSLFTSMYPFEDHIEENAERVSSGTVTLASVLRTHGYTTAAFVGSIMLDRRLGLDRGFDFYDSPFRAPQGRLENPYAVRVRRNGALVVRAAVAWLRAHSGQPVFVFVHIFDLHSPYTLPLAAHRPGISAYDAALEYVDRVIGQFRAELEQAGWWNRSLVVLLSDHGEGLGDHGEASHGYFVYQSTLRVPLMLHWPAGTRGYAARSTEPAALIDVAPTILDFLHIAKPPSFEGESLLPAVHGAPVERAVYSESLYTRDAFGWAPLRALRQGRYKYIEAPKPELYDLQRDPHELTNILRKNPSVGVALRRRLENLLSRGAARSPVTQAEAQSRAVLESLGYLGAARHAARSSGRDPKDGLAEYKLYERGLAEMYGGHPDIAVALFGRLLKHDPDNTLARCNLGDADLRLHRADEALRQWRLVLARDRSYAPAADAIAEVWLARRDYAKARSYFARAAEAVPNDYEAQFGLGTAEERLGAQHAAAVHFGAACKLAPDSPACRELEELRRTSR